MSPKLKRISGIVGFVILFAIVVYLKTERKMNRFSPRKPDPEMVKRQQKMMEDLKAKEIEEKLAKERRKYDSIAKIKRDSQRAKMQKIESLIKDLNKEIKAKKEKK